MINAIDNDIELAYQAVCGNKKEAIKAVKRGATDFPSAIYFAKQKRKFSMVSFLFKFWIKGSY